jgi:2-methylaconitate cis-trans-isomerase PrpF
VPGTDINYTFGYVGIANPVIDYTGNCGNTSAAVGPFVPFARPHQARRAMTKVRIYNTNTKKVILAEFQVENGEFISEGDFRIDGVPGSGSKILLDFIGSGGSVTGKLLPTGKVREEVKFPKLGTLEVSMVDAANPFVFVRARDIGLKGNENMDEFGRVQPDNPPAVRIGHPTGTIQVEIEIENIDGNLELTKAALARTARLLMDGNVYVRHLTSWR